MTIKKLWKTAKKMWIFVNIKIIQLRNQNIFHNFIFNKYWSDDSIISTRGEVWDHKTSLSLPLSTELPVPSQESELSCICVLGVSFLALSTILIFDFWIVPTVCYFWIVPTVYYFLIVLTMCYFLNCSDSVIF